MSRVFALTGVTNLGLADGWNPTPIGTPLAGGAALAQDRGMPHSLARTARTAHAPVATGSRARVAASADNRNYNARPPQAGD